MRQLRLLREAGTQAGPGADEYWRELLKGAQEFSRWSDSPATRSLQERNNSENIRYYTKRVKYYSAKLKRKAI